LLQRQLAEAEKKLAKGENFSLFSFVEAITAQAATKENLVYMRPQPVSVQEDFKEESVEIKLERIRLDQLVRLLYEIDAANAYLQVKNLRIKTRFDDQSQLNAVLTISSYGRSA
jgi:general secretion pathway protein M